jgi:hypothetical protein
VRHSVEPGCGNRTSIPGIHDAAAVQLAWDRGLNEVDSSKVERLDRFRSLSATRLLARPDLFAPSRSSYRQPANLHETPARPPDDLASFLLPTCSTTSLLDLHFLVQLRLHLDLYPDLG